MLAGTGKKGIIRPDEDGYYDVPVGAYNAYNNMKEFYDGGTAVPFFGKDSVLMRKIQKGVLFGEYKHPEKEPGMDRMDYLERIRRIDENRHATHIRNAWLIPSHDAEGREILLVMNSIRPHGPFKDVIKDALDNRHQNFYSSVRSITMDDVIRRIKYTKEIVTWDQVGEGGILEANKYNAPSLEAFQEASLQIQPEDVWALKKRQEERVNLGIETNPLEWDAIAEDMGWMAKLPERTRKTLPSFLNW
jgi:hypothetical protein